MATMRERHLASRPNRSGWSRPKPNLPPDEWTQILTNNGPPNAWASIPHGVELVRSPSPEIMLLHRWSFQPAHWDYGHQDEWLITPAFNCPPSAYLRFDGYVFLGSNRRPLHVKVSTDNGTNWTVLWDASAQTGGWNEYSSPIIVDLSAYSGNQVKIAFHAKDPADNTGLRYYWFIDNLYIGNSIDAVRFELGDFTTLSAGSAQSQIGGITPTRARSRDVEEGRLSREPRLPRPSEVSHPHGRSTTRVLMGYMVYRLQTEQEQNEDAWTAVTDEPITELSLSDTGWATLANGYYRWAVKAVYTNNVTSVASFSNVLHKFTQTGMIVGTVRTSTGSPIVGATVTNGTVSGNTNSMGLIPSWFPSVITR